MIVILLSNGSQITSHFLAHYILEEKTLILGEATFKDLMVKEINDVKLIDIKRQLSNPLTKVTVSSENFVMSCSKEASPVCFIELKEH